MIFTESERNLAELTKSLKEERQVRKHVENQVSGLQEEITDLKGDKSNAEKVTIYLCLDFYLALIKACILKMLNYDVIQTWKRAHHYSRLIMILVSLPTA